MGLEDDSSELETQLEAFGEELDNASEDYLKRVLGYSDEEIKKMVEKAKSK